ncbi:hypothetical protein [Pedobacter nanyangensis]|uniref:hypothetical protein n=1 Tax=Pedobacter nanyangensis TaxID=1562389 RepID=UPI000DE2F6CC|nr:hypothetical protein [Pedobacter nanyangensis]
MNSSHVDFYIVANINGSEKHIKVITLETTDGVPYYSCYIGENEITQLRNEIYGKWEQLWGNLPQETVNDIGEKILEKITPP